MDDLWLTTAEVAERLKVPESTLRYWRSRGEGPRVTKFGRHARYRASAVEAWEKRTEAEQEAERRLLVPPARGNGGAVA